MTRQVACAAMVVALAAAGACRSKPGAGDAAAPEAGVPVPPTQEAPAQVKVVPSATPAPPPAEETPADGDLHAEARDRNPRSATVKLRLAVTPAARGTVHWGKRKIADLKPGAMVIEIERPRSSGPFDLLVRAEGFLPHHLRFFTDRDDRLSVRLYRPDDAHALLGYRPPPPAAPPP